MRRKRLLRKKGIAGCTYVHALKHLAEHDVLAIQPGRLHGGDEELATVSVGTSIGHGQLAGASVGQSEVLVFKFSSINGLTASSVALGEIPTYHDC